MSNETIPRGSPLPVDPDIIQRDTSSYGWIGRALNVPIEELDGGSDYLSIVEANRAGRRRGAFEEMFDPEAKDIPFVGPFVEIPYLFGMAKTAKKLSNDEEVTDQELLDLNYYIEYQRRKGNSTWTGKLFDLVQGTISFASEIGATAILAGLLAPEPTTTAAGAGIVTNRAARIAASKAARESVEAFITRVTGKTLGKLAGKGAEKATRAHMLHKALAETTEQATKKMVAKRFGSERVANYASKLTKVATDLESRALINQLVNPQRTVRAVAERRLHNAISEGDESVAASIAKGFMDMNFEYASEFSGMYLGKLANRILPENMRKKLGSAFLFKHIAKNTDTTDAKGAWKILNSMGVNGVLEEMGEERAGDFMRGLFGVQGEAGLRNAIEQSWPSLEQFSLEAVGFSVLPVMANSFNKVAGGITYNEAAEASPYIQSLAGEADVFAKTEGDIREEARVLKERIDAESVPWYRDTPFKFLEKVFGEERIGPVQDSLRRAGVDNLRIAHDAAQEADPDNPNAGADAIADYLRRLQRIQTVGIRSQEDVEQFNAGVRAGNIVQKEYGFIVEGEALSNPEIEDIRKRTGIKKIMDLTDADYEAEIGPLNVEQLTSTEWDRLSHDQKEQYKLQWNSTDAGYLKERYTFLRDMYLTGDMAGIEVLESLPVLFRGTEQQFRTISGYEITNRDYIYDKVDGKPRYVMQLGARTNANGTQIILSTVASELSIVEDTVEAKMKQANNGIGLTPEMNEWVNSVRSIIEGKKKKSKNDKAILSMTDEKNDLGRFEFFVKNFKLKRMGYEAHPDITPTDRQFEAVEMPDTFDGQMRAIIGDKLTDVMALTPEQIGRIERGARHERVRELVGERGAGRTKKARKVLSKAKKSALINRLDEALAGDMRTIPAREEVQTILEEMDRAGETFALTPAQESAWESYRESPFIPNETGEIMDRGFQEGWVTLPEEPTPRRVEEKPVRTGRQPARKTAADILRTAERRDPTTGEPIRRERETEQPEPEFAERVYTEEELRSVAPAWLTDDTLERWLSEFDVNMPLEDIVAESRDKLIAEGKERQTRTLAETQRGRQVVPITRPVPIPTTEAMTAELRNAPFRLEASKALPVEEGVAATSAKPLSPEAAQLPFDVDLDALEDVQDASTNADIGQGIERAYAENAKVNPIWREAHMSRGRIDEQLESVSVVGGQTMKRFATTLSSELDIPLHDHAWIPSISDATFEKYDALDVPREERNAWWVKRVGEVGAIVHHVKAMQGIFEETTPEGNVESTQGWVAVVDNTENGIEEDLGLPVQSLVHAARYGRHPMGDRAEIDTPINEEVDFLKRIGGTPVLNTMRSSVFQIPASEMATISQLPSADRAAAEEAYAEDLRQWILRNSVRRIGFAGYNQVVGEKMITPEWASTFSGIVSRAIGPDIVKRRIPMQQAPISLTQAEIQNLERDLQEGTFALEPAGLGTRIFTAANNFNNGNLTGTADGRRMQRMIGRALQGDELAKGVVWRNLLPADQRAFGNLLRPEAVQEAVAGAPETAAQPLDPFEDDFQTEMQFQQEQETNALESINSLTDTIAPTFVSGAPGLHRELLQVNRRLRAMQFDEHAFIDRTLDRLGLIGRRKDLPDDHREQANEMLEAVTAYLERNRDGSIPEIPVRQRRTVRERILDLETDKPEIETKSAEEIAARWDEYVRNNNLDMPTVQELADQMRAQYDKAIVEANEMVKKFSDGEWIRYLENYVPHYYRARNDQELKESTRKLVEDTKSSKDRRIPTYQEAAEKYGLMPRTMNALDIYKSYNNTLTSAMRNKALVNTASIVRDMTGKPIVIPVQNASLGPNDNTLVSEQAQEETLKALAEYLDAPYDASLPPSQELTRLVGTMNLESEKYQRMDSPYTDSVDYFIVQKGVASQLMKSILQTGRIDNKTMNAIEHFNAWSKFMMLSFSAFHPFALGESLSASFGVGLEFTEDTSMLGKVKKVAASVAGNPAFHWKRTGKTINDLVKDMRENPQDYREWIEAGLMVNITNPDIKLGIVEKDIQRWLDKWGDNPTMINQLGSKGLNVLQKYKDFLDRWLWNTFHPGVKMMAAQNVYNDWLGMNPDSFEEQQQQAREHIAEYINNAFGGQEWDLYPWATPFAKQALHAVMFAPDWSLSAANVSGLTRLPMVNKIHATGLSPLAKDQMLRRYWPAMTTIVLFGLPNMVQFAIWSASKVLGQGEPEDEPFTFLNEPGRRTHIDVTPMFRGLPGNTGTEQGRRTYLRWGKQAYEISEGWLGDPRMILRKSSSAVRQAWETVTGNTVTGWELPFKDEGFAGIIAADGSVTEGRAAGVVRKFLPISLTAIAEGKPAAFIAPTSKGVSYGGVVYSMSKALESYVNRDALPKGLREVEPRIVVGELVDAAERNGYNAENAYKQARSRVASKYYKEFFEALNDQNVPRMEEAARKVLLLGRGMDDFHRSMEGRFESLNRIYSDDYRQSVQQAVTQAEE